MAWTDPATHVFITGEIVTAGTMNTFGKDNSLDLHRRTTAVTALVSTSETTTSTTYTDLTTSGPAVTVDVGSSGLALVCLYALLDNNNTAGRSFMGYAASGATTQSAADSRAISHGDFDLIEARVGAPIVNTSLLNAGSNTFTAKYAVSAGTGTFQDRRITVIPLGS